MSAVTTSTQPIADQLCDALVDYLSDQLSGDALDRLMQQELQFVLDKASEFTLESVVSREQVQITARKYAVHMDISGAIPELVGNIVERLYEHSIQQQHTIGEVIGDQATNALLDKCMEIPLSRQGMAWMGQNPVLLAVLAGGAQLGVKTWLHQGVPAMLRDPLLRRLPRARLAGIESRLQEWLLARCQHLLNDPYLYSDSHMAELRDLILLGWDEFAQRPMADLQQLLSSEDIQELFVILFEYWRTLRDSDYFITLLDTGVDTFFDTYGDTPLIELLEEVGVTQDMMLDDARRFVPPIMATLQQHGIVQEWLRRHLSPFFASPKAQQILHPDSP